MDLEAAAAAATPTPSPTPTPVAALPHDAEVIKVELQSIIEEGPHSTAKSPRDDGFSINSHQHAQQTLARQAYITRMIFKVLVEPLDTLGPRLYYQTRTSQGLGFRV